MILVAGGTGRLGHLVVSRLVDTGHPLRVLSRGRAHPALDRAADVVVGDVRDVDAVGRAMRDVSVVVSAVQGFVGAGRVTPASVDRDGNRNLVEAARREGADVVLMSATGAATDAMFEIGRMKYAAERSLWQSGCAGTVIRSAAFVQTWLEVLQDSAGRGRRPRVLGRGDNPIPWIDVDEVAEVVVAAVATPALRGRTLDLVGPERLTLDELARAMMAGLGWQGDPQHVPRAAVWVAANSVGRLVPQVGRICRMALAMDHMDHPTDGETRALFPGLAATPASVIAGAVGSTGGSG